MLTPELLSHIYGCSLEKAALYCQPLLDAADEFEINTTARLAAFLAQVGEESGRLMYVEEIASGNGYNGDADLGNTKPDAYKWAGGALPGPYFKGHGLLQITGFDNHLACGQALYPQDPTIFLRNPRLLCQPKDAARSAGWYWSMHGCNALADVGDFREITRKINGAYNGMNDRLALWARAKATLSTPAPASAPVVASTAPPPPADPQPAACISAADIAAAEEALHMEPEDAPNPPA